MDAKDSARDGAAAAGLCGDCRFAARQQSARGSGFWRCRRAESDPAFERYPRLPVRRCHGHERAGADPGRGPVGAGG